MGIGKSTKEWYNTKNTGTAEGSPRGMCGVEAMSFGAILSFAFGILGPAAIAVACVFEGMARRLAKDPRHDKDRVGRLRRNADIGLVAGCLLLPGAYLAFQTIVPDAEAVEAAFQAWMTWMLAAFLAADIIYLLLRRARPRDPNAKKRFWEI